MYEFRYIYMYVWIYIHIYIHQYKYLYIYAYYIVTHLQIQIWTRRHQRRKAIILNETHTNLQSKWTMPANDTFCSRNNKLQICVHTFWLNSFWGWRVRMCSWTNFIISIQTHAHTRARILKCAKVLVLFCWDVCLHDDEVYIKSIFLFFWFYLLVTHSLCTHVLNSRHGSPSRLRKSST